MKYKYTRDFIVNKIVNSEKTDDGHYWCPIIMDIILQEGDNDDSMYTYKREMFGLKLYFTKMDLDLLNAKKLMDIDPNEYYRKEERFFRFNVDLVNLSITDFIPGKKFTVKELIDGFEFLV